MTAADLYLLGVWQTEVGYNVAAAYAFHPYVDGWHGFCRLEEAAFISLSHPTREWAESRARAYGEPSDPVR